MVLPWSSCSVPRMRIKATSASGAAPAETVPSARRGSRVRTRTVQDPLPPRRAVVSAGRPTFLVPHVRDHERVAGEQLGIRLDEVLKVTDRLLLALHEEPHADRKPPGQCLHCARVG